MYLGSAFEDVEEFVEEFDAMYVVRKLQLNNAD
jgi:hypothetical protein